MHYGICLTRKIYTTPIKESKLVIVLVQTIHSCPLPYIHKCRITGIHESLFKSLASMPCCLAASYPSILNYPVSGAVKRIALIHSPSLKSRRESDHLCRGSRFICITYKIISPHIIELIHLTHDSMYIARSLIICLLFSCICVFFYAILYALR